MPAAILITARSLSLLALAAIGAVAGVYWFVQGLRSLQRRRVILKAAESTVHSATAGLVEVSGSASSPYVMLSPLKRAECYYYRSVAWQLKGADHDARWTKVAEEILHVPFYLDDGTGKVLIDPRGAEMDLQLDFEQEYHPPLPIAGTDMPGCVAEFLARHGIDPEPGIKVEEWCIKPKSLLFALGTLSQNPGLDASVTPAWARRVEETRPQKERHVRAGDARTMTHIVRLSEPDVGMPATSMTQQQKIAAALSKAGINNPSAWNSRAVGVKTARPEPASSSVALETADAEPQSGADETEAFDLHPPLVLMKGSHQPEFFISWRSQRETLKTTGWDSYLLSCGGAMLALTSIYLIAHFHWL